MCDQATVKVFASWCETYQVDMMTRAYVGFGEKALSVVEEREVRQENLTPAIFAENGRPLSGHRRGGVLVVVRDD